MRLSRRPHLRSPAHGHWHAFKILMSSRWYGAPGDYAVRRTGMSTIGVLVYLDGSRSFRSWDGDMVRALVCFSVDGRLVRVASAVAPQNLQHHLQPVSVRSPPPPPPANLQPLLASTSAVTPNGSWAEEIAPWEAAARAAAAAAGSGVGVTLHQPAGVTADAGGPAYGSGGAAYAGSRMAGAAGGVTHLVGASSTVRVGASAEQAAAASGGASAALGLALPKDRDLFPTITIHSANTDVSRR